MFLRPWQHNIDFYFSIDHDQRFLFGFESPLPPLHLLLVYKIQTKIISSWINSRKKKVDTWNQKTK